MPNWCNNSITIKGSTKTIQQLWEDATADDGSGNNHERGLLDAMVPMPAELNDTVVDIANGGRFSDPVNWYDWRVSNWGTKWDVSTEGLEFTDHGDGTAEISGWFDSAWAPPVDAYSKFCEDMDGVYLEAYYEESGMCFVGYWSSEGGDDYYEYNECSSDNIRNVVPEYLVDYYDLDERLAEYEDMESEHA